MQIRVLVQGSLGLLGMVQAAAATSTPSDSSDVVLPPDWAMREPPEGAPAPFGADQLNASAPYLATLADLDELEAEYGGHTRVEMVAGRAAVLYVGERGDEPAWHVGTVSPQAVTEMLASCEADAEGEGDAHEAADGAVALAAQTRCSNQWCLENWACWKHDCTYCVDDRGNDLSSAEEGVVGMPRADNTNRPASGMEDLSAKYLVSETGVITTPDAQVEHSPTLQTPEEVNVSETPVGNAQRSSARQSDYATFPFMRPPLEIRTIIWEEALPRQRRLITSIFYDGRFAPPPPALAHAYRESRIIALRHGSYRYVSFEHYSAWFRPKMDVVCWKIWDAAGLPEWAINHAAERLAIFFHPANRFGGVKQKYLWEPIEYIAHDPELWENLRTVDIVLSGVQDCFVSENLEPTAAEELFGNHTAAMVDLKDGEECSRVMRLLRQDHTNRSSLDGLIRARRILDGSNQTASASWTKILGLAQYSWLKGAYKREKGRVTDTVKVDRDSTKWDLDHPWIKRALANMPEVRPFFMLARKDHTWRSWGKAIPIPRIQKNPSRKAKQSSITKYGSPHEL
ncbi:hypothetical protein DL765_002349 [Monosporascus sp. GIB2]|nr:hypothetical protein DL765_002349 [Monosporascus sp. GIB2]